MDRSDARQFFFRPFFTTKKGQLLGWAKGAEPVHDGLALALLARHFPLPELEGITLECARAGVQPAENILVVGSSATFASDGQAEDIHASDGEDRESARMQFQSGIRGSTATAPRAAISSRAAIASGATTSLAELKLADRLQGIRDRCCFQFREALEPELGQDSTCLVNDVTNEVYPSYATSGRNLVTDWGVIRRIFRTTFENTIVVEGVHRLGTLGAAKVATSPLHLEAVRAAVRKLPAFDEGLPLEVLVRSNCTESPDAASSLDRVNAVPLAVVYNRQWIYDFADGQRWKDQMPWQIHVRMRGGEAFGIVRQGENGRRLPRVEVEADLREARRSVQQSCMETLVPAMPTNGPATFAMSAAEADALLEHLSAEFHRFRVVLVEEAPFSSSTEKHVELPLRGHTKIRKLRKRFFVHLALSRMLGRPFPCDEPTIRRYFPEFEKGASRKSFVSEFIGAVPGKMRDGFKPLLGEANRPKDLVRIEYERKSLSYALQLDRASLVVRLRV